MNRLLLKKEGKGKYLSHLDLMRTMQRAFIRAGIKIRHTQGFNPHPYMSFALPLSLGVESSCELMDFDTEDETVGGDFGNIRDALNEKLPEGIQVESAYRAERKFKEIRWLDIFGDLYYDSGILADNASEISSLFLREQVIVEKKSKRGMSQTDILPLINAISFAPGDGVIELRARISAQEPSLNPALLIAAIEKYLPKCSPDFYQLRRLDIYDKDFNIFR